MMSMHQQMRSRLNSQQGFTLIEIAIVLVIIGLLLGGVLKGQELINTARVRALNNSVDGITAAWFSFQDRYRAYPGDYLAARAVINLPGVLGGGDGNGRVGFTGALDSPAERGFVWAHLEAAGYITGSYDGAVVAPTAIYTCTVLTCPDNGFGTGIVITHGLVQTSAVVGTTGSAHELITGQGVPVDVLAELDRKVDDGIAATGLMQIGSGGTTWDGAAEAACLNGVNYQLQTPSDNCAAVFRSF